MKEETLLKGEKYLGRKVKEKYTFSVPGTFESYYAACGWCHENGYSDGSMCGDSVPIALVKGQYNLPQKWKNMVQNQKNAADGLMVSNDFREGSVTVYIFN